MLVSVNEIGFPAEVVSFSAGNHHEGAVKVKYSIGDITYLSVFDSTSGQELYHNYPRPDWANSTPIYFDHLQPVGTNYDRHK